MSSSIGPVRMTIAIVLIAVGAIGFVVFLVTSLLKSFGTLERVDIPGARDLTLEPGRYTIYWESDSRFSTVPSLSDLDVAVVSKDATVRLPLAPSGLLVSRYSTFERTGVSIAGMAVDRGGLYSMTVAPAAGKSLSKGGLAVGRSVGILGVLRIILTCLVILGAGVGTGVYLLVKTPS